jgi:hypothetical protein
VTRKPRSSRLPPKLPDHTARHEPGRRHVPNVREQLKQHHVAGRSLRFGRDEVLGLMRQVVHGAPQALLGLPAFTALAKEQVEAAVDAVYGWDGDGPRARIAPARTVDGFTAGVARVLEVARSGGRVTFATARPAALLPMHRRLAARAGAEGAEVLAVQESAGFGPSSRRIRWFDHVAVLTDGAGLLGDATVEAAEEWLFTIARPDLVIADHVYAGVALASGLEVVAFADLDAVALAVAAWQGRSVRIVPLDDRRAPGAYAPLLDLVESLSAVVVDPFTAADVPGGAWAGAGS